MIAELGHFALILAFALAIAQTLLPLWGAQKGHGGAMAAAAPLAVTGFLLTALAFAALTRAFLTSDFSVALVAANSHSAKPWLYKWSGVWGNHEGSLLLWLLILTLYGALAAVFGRNLPATLKARVLGIQGLIGVGFGAFILFTSNPFLRLADPPLDGRDLNPLLQDPGLAFHPPFLYLGYVGFSMAFSFAVAALIEGRIDSAWARWMRPWALAAWIFLTLGIALGSYWAYYELGWGGWWFWDPVENASFMPWLIGGALIHSAVVVEKRGELKAWTTLLAILAFSLSLVGAFIVRSGIITSVHAFASDPTRGVFILGMLAAATGGALALYAWRAPLLVSDGVFKPVSREGALVFNNLFLSVATAAVFIGTLWPLALELMTGEVISVGEPFFDSAFGAAMLPLLIGLPFGAMLPWKRADLGQALTKLWWVGAGALLVAAAVALLQGGGRGLGAPLGLALAFWVGGGAVADLGERAKVGKVSAGESLRRLANLPRSAWGAALAHLGVGLTLFGIMAVSAWEVETIRAARPGDSFQVGAYEMRFEGVDRERGPNYLAEIGEFTVLKDGRIIDVLRPEKRIYPVQGSPTTEAAIRARLGGDVYVVLGDRQPDGAAWAVRAYEKPWVNWIWIGALVMALGGTLSLADRRLRVGAPAPKKARAPAAAPPAMQAAE
ncbi:heme lyase CcmF/NrfE family subunit [Neomegalonema sp.]|uniref:heme lyase CcmF/NrfE family subunit n=1 Tax=Neomegalonema sp. TaxID=2039713 RepID=UPI00260D5961|nr:heme lyase CcmF/NrfE family subunit [Neomegalonema sp.]MDD2868763.1 heme lyase CcmF/NrfE family subunit [Neomegalonema sp.]